MVKKERGREEGERERERRERESRCVRQSQAGKKVALGGTVYPTAEGFMGEYGKRNKEGEEGRVDTS